MISSTLGAPLGGTMFGGQPGLESAVVRPILPANGAGGAGILVRSRVVVALGEPGVPVVWTCAKAKGTAIKAAAIPLRRISVFVFIVLLGEFGCRDLRAACRRLFRGCDDR